MAALLAHCLLPRRPGRVLLLLHLHLHVWGPACTQPRQARGWAACAAASPPPPPSDAAAAQHALKQAVA
eukprot:1159606-Pelagomonas_calceolata.AAC.4